MAKSAVRNLEPKRAPGRPTLDDTAGIEGEVLAAALREFLANGYGGASMSGIVEAAGISKTTLYSRFASKDELFRAVVAHQIDELSASIALEQDNGDVSLQDGLEAYANRALEFSLKGDELAVNRLIYSESHRFPELGIMAWERTQLGIKNISAFMRERGAAQRVTLKEADAAAEAFILLLRGYFVNVMLTNRKVTAQQRKKWVKSAVRTFMLPWQKW